MPAVDVGKAYPSGHNNPGVEAVMFCLERWLLALEDGSHVHRLPDFSYQRSRGRAQWTEEELDRLVRDIDAEIDQEVPRLPGTQAKVRAKAGSGFHRLAVPQRLALAQELDRLIAEHADDLKDYAPREPTYDPLTGLRLD